MSIAVKVAGRYVALTDDLYSAILTHASANFRLGRDKVADRAMRNKEATMPRLR